MLFGCKENVHVHIYVYMCVCVYIYVCITITAVEQKLTHYKSTITSKKKKTFVSRNIKS